MWSGAIKRFDANQHTLHSAGWRCDRVVVLLLLVVVVVVAVG